MMEWILTVWEKTYMPLLFVLIWMNFYLFESHIIGIKTIFSVLKVSIEYSQEFKVRYMHMIRNNVLKSKMNIPSIGMDVTRNIINDMDNRNDLLYYYNRHIERKTTKNCRKHCTQTNTLLTIIYIIFTF